MRTRTTEQRVAALAADIKRLRALLAEEPPAVIGKTQAEWLYQTFGVFKDDPDFEAAVHVGQQWRQSEPSPDFVRLATTNADADVVQIWDDASGEPPSMTVEEFDARLEASTERLRPEKGRAAVVSPQ